MPPVAVNVVLAVHRSSCRKFHPCIFDCATYSCLAVSVDPIQGQCQVYRSPARFVSIESFCNLSIRELAERRLHPHTPSHRVPTTHDRCNSRSVH